MLTSKREQSTAKYTTPRQENYNPNRTALSETRQKLLPSTDRPDKRQHASHIHTRTEEWLGSWFTRNLVLTPFAGLLYCCTLPFDSRIWIIKRNTLCHHNVFNYLTNTVELFSFPSCSFPTFVRGGSIVANEAQLRRDYCSLKTFPFFLLQLFLPSSTPFWKALEYSPTFVCSKLSSSCICFTCIQYLY